MVVPFAPGGSSDVVRRLIGVKIAASLKQTVIVDNRAGAGGAIGSDIVAKSAPDDYTLLLMDTLHIVSPLFSRNALYDPIPDFTPKLTLPSRGRTCASALTALRSIRFS